MSALSVSTIRRRLAREGLRLWIVPSRSRWFAQYGPVALVDASTNALVSWGFAEPEDVLTTP